MDSDRDTKSQLRQISAELKLLNSKRVQTHSASANPWINLEEAAKSLHFRSARALKERIKRGQFPVNCWRQIPTPSGKRHTYLVNVERYLRHLN